MSRIPDRSLPGHSLESGDIALVYNLSGQHFRHESISQHQEEGHDAGID